MSCRLSMTILPVDCCNMVMMIMIVMMKKMDLQNSMIRTRVLLLDDGNGDGDGDDESEAFLTNHLILGICKYV